MSSNDQPTTKGKEPRKPISVCGDKYDALATAAGAPSRNALIDAICAADKTGKLSDNSFRQQIARGALNATYREATGKFCSFDGDDAAFISGSLADFEDLLKRRAERRVDQPLRRMRGDDPWSRDTKLASLELAAGQWAVGSPTPVFVKLTCRPGPMGNIDVAVRRGALTMELLLKGKAVAATTTKRMDVTLLPSLETHERSIVVKSDFGNVSFGTRSSGRSAAWDVRAEGGYIGRPDVPDDLCKAHNLANGDSIRATFTVYIKDLEPLPPDATGDKREATLGGPSSSFMAVEPGKLGAWTRNLILLRLAEKEAFGAGVSEIDLCRDEIHFEGVDASSSTTGKSQ